MIQKRHKTILIVALIWFLIATTFVAHKSAWLQLAAMAFFLPFGICAIASIVLVFHEWHAYKLRTLVPLGACVAAWFGAFIAGSFIQAQLFTYNLVRYQAIVDDIDQKRVFISTKAETIDLSEDDYKLVYSALAQRAPDGSLIVELLTESGFPVKHSGYVYSSSGVLTKDSFIGQRWPHVREVRPKWFRVAD